MEVKKGLPVRNRVKAGYKQTGVGVIPEDWEVKQLGDVADIVSGGTPSTNRKEFWDGDIYWCTPTDITALYGSKYLIDTTRKISLLGLKNCSAEILPENSILMTTRATIGECAINKIPVSTNQGFKSFIPKGINAEFLYQKLLAQKSKFIQLGSGSTFFEVSKKDITDFLIDIPPTKAEQTAIASALRDADALIQSMEKLITKKRNIKHGAMQELLKPKEGWDRKPLKEVSFMKGRIGWQGLKQTEFTMNADEPFLITGMNFKDGAIRWDEVYHVSFERYQIAKEIQLKQNDVLMTKDGTIGKLLFIDKIPYPGKATLNSHLLVFRPIQNSYDPKFLYYQLSSKSFKEHIELSKSGTTFFGLSQEAVGNYPAFLPPLNEQTRIATIISDMDAEISALESKLVKYKQVKQGMMQKLLTGKIRLLNIEASAKPKATVTAIPVQIESQKKKHTWEFNEAVVISALSKAFGTQSYPLGRRRYTKLSYLLHRYAERNAKGYLKKAAGPYNPSTKYGGPEKIAQARGYIKYHSTGNYSGYIADDNIEEAVTYFNKWYGQETLRWLEQFRYKDKDQLELLTTVDMAVQDLVQNNQKVSVASVKAIIKNHDEWRAKLERPNFSDNNINAAIRLSEDLFGS